MKLSALLLGCIAAACVSAPTSTLNAPVNVSVPILVYHRVCNGKPGSTTVTPDHFRSQVRTLRDAGFHVIPLSNLVAWKAGRGAAPDPRSVVITFDDGHASFFDDAKPIIDDLQIPVTQFLVTGCISSGTYCVSWDQVSALLRDPLIDIGSHTSSHPSFTREARRRRPASYRHFVDLELAASKVTLERKLNRPIPMLAWPYGIYSPLLLSRAAAYGYKVGFSVECRAVTQADPMLAIPRCMVLDSDLGPNLLQLLSDAGKAATALPINRKWRIQSADLALRTNME